MLPIRLSIVFLTLCLTILLITDLSYSEECKRAVELYNKGTSIEDSSQKEQFFKNAIPLCSDPEILSHIYNNLADLYEKKGNYSNALVNYRKAIKLKPDLATSYFSVGDIFLQLKDYYSSYIMYNKGLKYQEDDEETLKNMEKAKEGFKERVIIYFDFDSAQITSNYTHRLQLIGESAQSIGLKERKIIIQGHTDATGPSAYNQLLSRKRAEDVKSYLINNISLDVSRFEIKTLGETAPLLPNTDQEGRSLNRRVEILLTYQPL